MFFGIAIIAAIARIGIRLRLRLKLRLDDYFLLSSCLFLSATTGLIFYNTQGIFLAAALILNPSMALGPGVNKAELLEEMDKMARISRVYVTFSWVCIFLIKFGFLALFRSLVDRLPILHTCWKAAVTFTGIVAACTIGSNFIACPKTGIKAG